MKNGGLDAQHCNKLYACTFRNGNDVNFLQRLDLAEHDVVTPVVELHRVVVAHGVVAAEVDTLLKKYILSTMLTNVVFTFVIKLKLNLQIY